MAMINTPYSSNVSKFWRLQLNAFIITVRFHKSNPSIPNVGEQILEVQKETGTVAIAVIKFLPQAVAAYCKNVKLQGRY